MTANLVLIMTTTGDKVKVEFSLLGKDLKVQCFDCEFLDIWEWLKITRGLYQWFFHTRKFRCVSKAYLKVLEKFIVAITRYLADSLILLDCHSIKQSVPVSKREVSIKLFLTRPKGNPGLVYCEIHIFLKFIFLYYIMLVVGVGWINSA